MKQKLTYFYSLLLTAALLLPWGGIKADAISLPYNYGFETNFDSEGWTLVNPTGSNSSYVGVKTDAKKTGTYGYRLSSYSTSANQYLISAELNAATGVVVQFYYKASSSTVETFKVGYSTTTAETASFTWSDPVSTSGTNWTLSEEYNFPAGTKYVAINYYSNTDKYHLYIDDLEFSAPAACAKPELTLNAYSKTSASFSWSGGSAWEYLCLPAATTLTDEHWESATQTTNTSVTVDELTQGASYIFYLRADCGIDGKSKVANVVFSTAKKVAPWSENFDGMNTNTIPTDWDNSGSASSTAAGSSKYYVWGVFQPTGGSKMIRMFNNMVQSGSALINTPAIYLPEGAQYELKFDYSQRSNCTTFVVKVSTDGGKTFTKIGPASADYYDRTASNNTGTPGDFTTETISLNSYVGKSIILQFYSVATYNGGSIFVDNVNVKVASSCTDPTGVSAAATAYNKASVSWTEAGSATTWNIQYSTDNFSTHTDINGVTDNPYELTGLSGNTTYKVRVQADCGGSEPSDWVVSAAFETPCEPTTGIGWTANFAGASTGSAAGLPECWVKNSTNSYPYIYQYGARSNSRCLYFGGTSTAQPIAVLPPFSEETNTLYVTLWYNNAYDYGDYSASSYGQLAIGYMTNPSDASTFVAQETFARVNTYTQAKVALTDAPTGSRVAIRYVNGGSSTGYMFVDDIAITAIPSCMAPSAVTGSATAYNTASISWTANGSESAWKLQYSADGGSTWTDANSGNSITTNPYILTGLSGNTSYIVCVKADCGGESSDWSANSAAIPTPCQPADASDYGETFEDATSGSGNLPDCWQYKDYYINWDDKYPYVYNSGAYQGSKMLYFYGGGAASVNTVLLPPMDETLDGLTIEFYYSTSVNYSTIVYGSPVLGYIAADGTTFVEIETLAQSADYVLYKKNLSSVPETAKYLAIQYAKGTAGSGHMYLDNVRVYPTPNCLDPTGVTVSNVTATTADVAWTENNGKSTWKLQISNNGSTWTDVNGGADITANPFTLTGLTSNHTTYYVRAKTICGTGDESPWSAASAPFETECGTVALPFNEDFGGANLGCWTKEHCFSNTGLYNGTFMFYYNNTWSGEEPPQYLISPEINTENKPVTVEFDYYMYSGTETFKVGYSTTTNDVSAFTWGNEISCTNTSSTNPDSYSENFPAGVKYVAIMHTSDDQYYLYIDNFSVVEYIAPACPAVSAATLQESAVTANSATISWTAGGEETAWNLQYKAAGGEWSEPVAISTTPSYDMTGLTANTLYYVHVQANCGDGTSEWTGDEAFSFRTDCEQKAVSKASPWEYGFEDVEDGAFPSCWERTEAYANHGYPVVAEYSHYAQTGDKYLYFYTPARNGGPAYTEDAILPVFNTEIKNLKVSFAYFNNSTGTNYGQLAIGYVVGDAFTQVGELVAKVDDYTTVEREMPNDAPDGARIAIRCIGSTKSGNSTYVYLDDVTVSLKPTCYTPTALAAAETSDGAQLTWTAGKDENEWNVRYSEKDADTWTTINEIATNGYTLTGLSLDVTYEVQVKAVCGEEDESEWSASVEFTPACNAPLALAVTARTQTSATFSWISSESAWVLQYSVDGENWESENVNANPYTLNNLTAGQTYQAKIQAACGSAFSNVVEFTTVCAMHSAAELPLSEDFTGIADYALPACWESATASVESEKLFFRGADEQIVVLPGYDVALNKLSVSFDYTLNNASMQFGYVETIDGEFHSLAELEGTAFEADLTTAPAFAGYLAFRYYNSLSQYAANTIDNIVVMDKSALALDEKQDNTAVLAELVDETVTITIKRTIFCDGYFNTLCLPFDLDAAALAASPLAGYARLAKFTEATVESGSDELQLVYEYATSIEAGVPYLINFPAGENIVNPTFTNVTISATIGSNANLGNGIIVKGILKPEPFTAGNEDMLFLLGENKLSWAGVTNNLKGFRAYFQLDNTSNAPVRSGMPARIVERQNTPTGIDNANLNGETIKRLENNQVIIIRNGVKYNIQGQVIQ